MRKISATEMPINLAARSDVYIVNPESYVRSLPGKTVRVDYEGIPVIGTITESWQGLVDPGIVHMRVQVPIPTRVTSELCTHKASPCPHDPVMLSDGTLVPPERPGHRMCSERNPTGISCVLRFGHESLSKGNPDWSLWHEDKRRSRWPAVDLRGRHARRRRPWWRWS